MKIGTTIIQEELHSTIGTTTQSRLSAYWVYNLYYDSLLPASNRYNALGCRFRKIKKV